MSPAFTVSQSAITPQNFTVTDTSSGSLGTITQRRIYVQDAYGNYLTGNGTVNYDEWILANSTITLDVLTEDLAVDILVEWLNVSDVIVNSLDNTYPLSEFNKQFFYYLIQNLGLKPETYQDTNYSGNLSIFWANVVAGINAVTYGNDIAAAQNCFSRATFMRLNENIYF